MEQKEQINDLPLEIQTKTIQILKSCNKNQLLWIYERYFNKIYSILTSSFPPSMYLYQQNLEKQIPPGSFSDIIVMQVQMDSEKDKSTYDEFILIKTLEYLNC